MSVGYEFSLYSASIIMIKMQAVCLFGSVLITDRVRDALYINFKDISISFWFYRCLWYQDVFNTGLRLIDLNFVNMVIHRN